jgi:hypothetical protein
MIRTTDHVANVLFATSPYRANLSRDLRMAYAFSVARGIEFGGLSGQGRTELGQAVHNEIDALWDSLSWRALRPLRNLNHQIKGLPREARPAPRTDQEALDAIITLRQSLSWEITAPLRFAHRLLGSRRRSK